MIIRGLICVLFFGILNCYSQGLKNKTIHLNGETVASKNDLKSNIVDSNTIVYFLPDKVAELLLEEIKNKRDPAYFILGTINDSILTISAHTYDTEVHDVWPKMTNRKVFLNSKFFPLVFDYDRFFATSDRGDDILKKSQANKYFEIGRGRVISHYFYYVEFRKNDGEIVLTGYDGAIQK